ncbi:Sodium/calcium exchanger protein-domain-containing protein [Mycena metata]|uniref:Sodium/calcium exchanger protein-domain-containing protein n=1 Tax=Mycena metata TaxID=1033252 RepID=A0AAD7JXA0_9AGAR|nr:Sodium/calcium exchanger protein-domain-containing protein [Mycena metata]
MPDKTPTPAPPSRSTSINVGPFAATVNLRPKVAKRGDTVNLEAGGPQPASRPNISSSMRTIPSYFSNFPSSVAKLPSAITRWARAQVKPASEVGPIPTVAESLWTVLTVSYLNALLVFIPVSIALHFATPTKDVAIFSTAFIAIIPLAKLLAFATDELSLRVGQALAGLINATMGNAVELIVAIIALTHCELSIVQSSLIGSILSNLLLVLGMCFFCGGIKYSEQGFAAGAAQLNSSLLMISVGAMLLPAGFHTMSKMTGVLATPAAADAMQALILKFSHGIALVLLAIYGCYLLFQFSTHKTMYQDDSPDIATSTQYNRRTPVENINLVQIIDPSASPVEEPQSIEEDDISAVSHHTHNNLIDHNISPVNERQPTEDTDREPVQLNGWVCLGLLVVVTVCVAFVSEFLVGSINGLTASGALSKEFVGIVLLPIVGNAAEHATAVTVSVKDKLTLSMSVAVGSSIQIAMFVIPLIIVIGWGIGKPMTLLFDPFEAACLFIAVVTVNYAVQDGKSNWLEGAILMSLYAILGTMFFFYPGFSTTEHFAACT